MSKKVLVIESDSGFLENLQGAFTTKGFEVTGTGDWTQGLDLAHKAPPDLFLVSVELPPPANGYSVCTKLKKDDALRSIPVVLMSANATPETFEKHKKLKTRAEDYIIKPFEMPALFDKVGALVGMPEVEEVVEGGDEDVSVEELDESIAAEEVEEVAPPEPSTVNGDADLEALDDAFDTISGDRQPASTAGRPPPPPPEEEEPARTQPGASAVEEATDTASLERIADLEGTVAALEDALAKRDAEMEALRSSKSDAHAIKSELTKRDKEILRLKEEIHAKEKEALEAQERADDLETRASEAEAAAARHEAALKSATTRAEAAAVEKKKHEKELAAEKKKALDLEKKAQQLEGRLAEAEARADEAASAQLELESVQAAAKSAAGEIDRLKAQIAEMEAEAARNEERVVKAYQKIKGDEKLKEKTKKALQIALQLLEEQQAMGDEENPAADAG